MTITITTQPVQPAIDLTLLKEHLRIIGNDEDLTLRLYRDAAIEIFQSYSNLALITQTVTQRFDCFPVETYFMLERSPIQSISSIKYYDADNVLQTLSTDDYFLSLSNPPKICLATGKCWPDVHETRHAAVEVSFIVGYGTTSESVPADIKEALSLITGELLLNKEDAHTVQGITVRETFWSSNRILGRYRPYFYEHPSQQRGSVHEVNASNALPNYLNHRFVR